MKLIANTMKKTLDEKFDEAKSKYADKTASEMYYLLGGKTKTYAEIKISKSKFSLWMPVIAIGVLGSIILFWKYISDN